MGMNFTRYFNAPTLLIIHDCRRSHEKRATMEMDRKRFLFGRDLQLKHKP